MYDLAVFRAAGGSCSKHQQPHAIVLPLRRLKRAALARPHEDFVCLMPGTLIKR